MNFSNRRLRKIKRIKNQSRKRKRGGRKHKKRRSFRKNKDLDLRLKTLKNFMMWAGGAPPARRVRTPVSKVAMVAIKKSSAQINKHRDDIRKYNRHLSQTSYQIRNEVPGSQNSTVLKKKQTALQAARQRSRELLKKDRKTRTDQIAKLPEAHQGIVKQAIQSKDLVRTNRVRQRLSQHNSATVVPLQTTLPSNGAVSPNIAAARQFHQLRQGGPATPPAPHAAAASPHAAAASPHAAAASPHAAAASPHAAAASPHAAAASPHAAAASPHAAAASPHAAAASPHAAAAVSSPRASTGSVGRLRSTGTPTPAARKDADHDAAVAAALIKRAQLRKQLAQKPELIPLEKKPSSPVLTHHLSTLPSKGSHNIPHGLKITKSASKDGVMNSIIRNFEILASTLTEIRNSSRLIKGKVDLTYFLSTYGLEGFIKGWSKGHAGPITEADIWTGMNTLIQSIIVHETRFRTKGLEYKHRRKMHPGFVKKQEKEEIRQAKTLLDTIIRTQPQHTKGKLGPYLNKSNEIWKKFEATAAKNIQDAEQHAEKEEAAAAAKASVKAPVKTPVKAPVKTPVKAPVKTPVKAPVKVGPSAPPYHKMSPKSPHKAPQSMEALRKGIAEAQQKGEVVIRIRIPESMTGQAALPPDVSVESTAGDKAKTAVTRTSRAAHGKSSL